jgi:hypothetical protein
MRTLAAIAVCLLILSSTSSFTTLGAADVDFTKEVLPILKAKCFSCHGEKKGKSKLRLHSGATAIGGGKSKKAIVPGKPDESGVITRTSLARDDDDVMPPEDEGEAVTKAEIEILRRWITEGAKYLDGGAAPKKEKSKGAPLTDADQKTLASIRKAGARAMRVAQDVNWLSVSFRPAAAEINDDQVALVKDLANVTELNLAGTKVTDDGLANLAGLGNLTRLHLERTEIKGSGLAHIKGLSKLEYLNLYGTQVDDAALKNLEGLKSLKKLYLWQTKVTDAGVAALKKAHPELYINRGIDPPAKAHPGSESKPVTAKKPDPKKTEPKNTKPGQAIVKAGSGGWTFTPKKGVKGDAWVGDKFDDSKWEKGKTPIGYGEAGIAQKKGTTIKHVGQNVLARMAFNLDEKILKESQAFKLLVASDNSAIVWINGKQVDKDTDNHEPKYWNRTVIVAANVLRKGRNVIAVQITNNQGSSDAYFDVQLENVPK